MAEGAKEVWTPAKLNQLLATMGGTMMLPSRGWDEVFPGVYVAEGEVAKNFPLLHELQVTHVLNTCQGNDQWTQVDTSAETYKESGQRYFGLPGIDKPSYNMASYFYSAADFIQGALDSGGKVLIHCVAGWSRSATIAIAYLMIKHHIPVGDAVRLVRSRREIGPNNGFLKQLCDLHDKLLAAGHFSRS